MISNVTLITKRRVRGQWSVFTNFIGDEECCTVETGYKVAICPRGYLLNVRIYLITNLKLL